MSVFARVVVHEVKSADGTSSRQVLLDAGGHLIRILGENPHGEESSSGTSALHLSVPLSTKRVDISFSHEFVGHQLVCISHSVAQRAKSCEYRAKNFFNQPNVRTRVRCRRSFAGHLHQLVHSDGILSESQPPRRLQPTLFCQDGQSPTQRMLNFCVPDLQCRGLLATKRYRVLTSGTSTFAINRNHHAPHCEIFKPSTLQRRSRNPCTQTRRTWECSKSGILLMPSHALGNPSDRNTIGVPLVAYSPRCLGFLQHQRRS